MNAAHTVTAPERLQLLVPWLNGAQGPHVGGSSGSSDRAIVWHDVEAIRHAIDTFIASFDGSEDAGHVLAEPDDRAAQLTNDALNTMEMWLRMLLDQGFGNRSF